MATHSNAHQAAGLHQKKVVHLDRQKFPPSFIFGAASSAYQNEGGANEGGREASVWDDFAHVHLGSVKDDKDGRKGVDSYHLYKEDVKILKSMGVDAYRISISWSRILPEGNIDGGVNREGIKYYNDLINELLDNGIQPFVTLFHFDLPRALEVRYGGFLNEKIVNDFCDYAELCFWEFGDKVKYWITLNEPWSYSIAGYVWGSFPPARSHSSHEHIKDSIAHDRCHAFHKYIIDGNPGEDPYLVTHHQLLAHAAAVEIYKKQFQSTQNGHIGIVLTSRWFEPLNSNNQRDLEAQSLALDFMLGWFMRPLTQGHYPDTMEFYVNSRLPSFTTLQSNQLRHSFDFIGINYYTARYAIHDKNKHKNSSQLSYATDIPVSITPEKRHGKFIGPRASSDWLHIYPKGIYKLLLHIKDTYGDPEIYITENGVDDNKVDGILTLSKVRSDSLRIKFHEDHLHQLKKAINCGVNVKGYFIWSLLDNFEWQAGYTLRFGLVHVDHDKGFARYPKQSAIWFKNFLKRDNFLETDEIETDKTDDDD